MKHRTFIGSIVLAVLFAVRLSAHHTVARTHDVSRVVPLTGVVTSIRWENPHVVYHFSVPGAIGVDWEIEGPHLQGMRRDGIDKDTIKVGDHVTFNVFLALDGSHHAATASVVLPDGRKLRLCTVTYGRCP
jgi:hypothetical protein